MKIQSIQSIKGFDDTLPADSALWQQLHRVAAEVFAAYGYGEIKLPIVESTALFKRAVGEVTDIVEKEMFSFTTKGGEEVSLRPEGTAGCVRAALESRIIHNQQQQRLWYAGPMFRYERPQKGRLRQFHQLGAESYGMKGPDVDVEVVAMSARLLKNLGLTGVQLEVNSLGNSASRAAYRAALVEYLSQYQSDLDEDSQRRLHTNPLRILDSKVISTQALLTDAPRLEQHLDSDSRAHFDGFLQGLDDLSLAYVQNPKLVRGLDYYSYGVFEWTTTQLGSQGTVLAGGRYDGLVEQLGGQPTPAVGWASGIERLILLMQAQGQQASSAPLVYVCHVDQRRAAARLAESLRDTGISTVLDMGEAKFKTQLQRADRHAATFALILGSEEVAKGTVQVKTLATAEQHEIESSQLAAWLQAQNPSQELSQKL